METTNYINDGDKKWIMGTRDEKGKWHEELVDAGPLYTTYDENDPNFPEEKKMIQIPV